MWDYVGIVRTTKRLERALRRINMLQQEIDEYYAHFRVSNNLLELRNLVQVAELIVRCAINAQRESGLALHAGLPGATTHCGIDSHPRQSLHKQIKSLGQRRIRFGIVLVWPTND